MTLMRDDFFEIPEYHRYLSPELAWSLLQSAQSVTAAPGLSTVGDMLEDPEALAFLAELYRLVAPDLECVLKQRRLDREFLDVRTRACADFNQRHGLEISDPNYQDYGSFASSSLTKCTG